MEGLIAVPLVIVGRQSLANNGNFMNKPLSGQTLAGKNALVTGSSSGIGAAIAVALAGAGANVHLHTRGNIDGLRAVRLRLDELDSAGGDFPVDLTDHALLETFVEAAWQPGPLDIWVNNAGVDVLTGNAADWTFERKLAALWMVDVRTTIVLSRAIGQKMKQRGTGTIINMGWDQASTGMEGDSGEMFAAAKGAVMAHTKSLAKSLAPMSASTALRRDGFAPNGAEKPATIGTAARRPKR